MPAYDYFCPSCNNVQEVTHGMFEELEVKCEKCNKKMKKSISIGSGGYKITSGGTRRRDYGQRYGGKKNKSDYTPTPSESAHAKAMAQKSEKVDNSSDPYASFRE